MISIKNSEQLKLMRVAGRITGEALLVGAEALRDGVSTKEIDRRIRAYIEKCGARPSFLGYGGFPGSACISINNEVIHGIPSDNRVVKDGDIVKIDVGACYRGYHGDSARTFAVGHVSETAQKLIDVTREGFYQGVGFARAGNRVGDVGSAVERYVASNGFSVVRKYVGHGVGSDLHEDPEVPNFGTAGRGARLYAGMTIAIEPMVNVGTADVRVLKDGWTVLTADGKLSAHYEHTVLITDEEPILLTDVG
ncbi:MAG: type I methionyl aminopeptidase [Clostridia bacterium]|nr:type I methionyl aminopeptidase [Clostridia bacterium]